MDDDTKRALDTLSNKTDQEIAEMRAQRRAFESSGDESPNEELKKGVAEDFVDRMLGNSH